MLIAVVCVVGGGVERAHAQARPVEEKQAPVLEDSEEDKAKKKSASELTEKEEDALFDVDRRGSRGPDSASVNLEDQRDGEKELSLMSQQELRAAGFVFGDQAKGSGARSTGTLLAVTAGAAAHGIGHWYMGDRRSAIALAVMEATGIGLWTAAEFLPLISGAELGKAPYSRPLLYSGIGLFGASYLLDVIGTVQGSEQLSFINANRVKGVSVGVRYGYMQLDDVDIRNVMRVDLEADAGWGYLLGHSTQDVGLQVSTYQSTLGMRLWRDARRPQTQVFVEGEGNWLVFRKLGRFERLMALGRVGGALDLGVFSSHFNRVVIGLKGGYTRQWYAFPAEQDYDPLRDASIPEGFGHSIGGISLETFVHFNLSERMHARFAYTRQDGAFLHDLDARWGVPSIQINYRSAARLDIELIGQYGSGLGLWTGLRYWLWQADKGKRARASDPT